MWPLVITVFWYVTPCNYRLLVCEPLQLPSSGMWPLAIVIRQNGSNVEHKTAAYISIVSSVLKIEAPGHSETAVNNYQNNHCHKLRLWPLRSSYWEPHSSSDLVWSMHSVNFICLIHYIQAKLNYILYILYYIYIYCNLAIYTVF